MSDYGKLANFKVGLMSCSAVLLLASGCASVPTPPVRQEFPKAPPALMLAPQGTDRICELAKILNAPWCSSPSAASPTAPSS